MIWYYLVHDNFFASGLDWGTIIPIFNMGFFVMLILRMLYKKLTTYRYSIDIVQDFPLFCPKCKLTHIIDVEKLEIVIKNTEKQIFNF